MTPDIAAPVAPVPYWTYLVPVAIAFIGVVNTLGLAYIAAKFGQGKKEIVQSIVDTKQSVVVLEKQINSNLDKQIKASIGEAVAMERLHVEQAKKENV